MSRLFMLGLVFCATAPAMAADPLPTQPPQAPPRPRPVVPPMYGFPQHEPLALGEADRLDAEPSVSRWLSARERWCRRKDSANSTELLDYLTLVVEFEDCPGEAMGSWVCGLDDLGHARLPKSPRYHGWNPTFTALLLESLAIRTSDLSPYDKGRAIARLIEPWMTRAHVHALFGESEAVLYEQAACRIIYVDYGVAIDRCRVLCRDDSPDAKEVRWDAFTEPLPPLPPFLRPLFR